MANQNSGLVPPPPATPPLTIDQPDDTQSQNIPSFEDATKMMGRQGSQNSEDAPSFEDATKLMNTQQQPPAAPVGQGIAQAYNTANQTPLSAQMAGPKLAPVQPPVGGIQQPQTGQQPQQDQGVIGNYLRGMGQEFGQHPLQAAAERCRTFAWRCGGYSASNL